MNPISKESVRNHFLGSNEIRPNLVHDFQPFRGRSVEEIVMVIDFGSYCMEFYFFHA
jgi:hypothetical protein